MKDMRRRQDAEPPVKMHSVRNIWRWSCQGRFAALVTPSAKSEGTLVASQVVIGEIKMASILRMTPAPTVRPRPAGRLLASDSWNRRAQSKCDRWKKVQRGLYEVTQQWRKDVLWPVKL